jgi:hypothetical protein
MSGLHPLAKTRTCPECGNIMYRVQIRYRENRTEHYQCINELCLAKVRIVIMNKTVMKVHTMVVEMEKRLAK